MAGEPYAERLISKDHDFLMEVKRGNYPLEQARAMMNATITFMQADKQRYMDTVPVQINEHANAVLRTATVEILKRCFLTEIQGGDKGE